MADSGDWMQRRVSITNSFRYFHDRIKLKSHEKFEIDVLRFNVVLSSVFVRYMHEYTAVYSSHSVFWWEFLFHVLVLVALFEHSY